MTISRRQLLATGAAFGLAGTLAACTGNASPTKGGSTITYWNNFQDTQQTTYFREHIMGAYPGPGKPVLVSKSSGTIDKLIQTALAAGSGPDVIETPGPSTNVVQYNKAGFLLDLSKYSKKYGWEDKFTPWALNASKIGGKLPTLPTQYETMVFYYNPAVVKKLGLTVPKSQDEFENYCTEAKGKGITPVAAGNADYKGANEWHMVVALNQAAGPEAVYSALKGETKWTDPVFVDAITRFTDYFKKGWYGGGVQSYFTNHFPTVYKQLANGQGASMISGTWEFSSLIPYFGKAAGNDQTWDWATLPSLGKGVPHPVWDLAIGQSNGVNAHSKNVDDAVAFLNFMTTDKKTIIDSVVKQNFEPPPIKIAASDFGSDADPRIVRLYTEYSAAKTVGYTTWTFFPPQTETYIIDYFENVITNAMSPKDYCAGIQSKFDPEFKAGLVPAVPKPGTAVA